MDSIKLGDLYLSKEKSKDIIELLTKKRNIKNYTSKSSDKLYNIFKKQCAYNILKGESQDIKRTLYNIEQRKKISSGKTSKY